MVDAQPQLFMSLLCFPVDLAIIVIIFLLAHHLIVASMFGLMDHFIAGWDPGPDARRPSTRRQRRKRPKHSPFNHRWNHCRQRYNRQWALRRVYPFCSRRFEFQLPDVFPDEPVHQDREDHGPDEQDRGESTIMPFLFNLLRCRCSSLLCLVTILKGTFINLTVLAPDDFEPVYR